MITIMEMLQQKFHFWPNPEPRSTDFIDNLLRLGLPEDLCAFYCMANGGSGRIDWSAQAEPEPFVLYTLQEMQEKKVWFTRFSSMIYQEAWLLDERPPNPEELTKLERVAADLIILGEYGKVGWLNYILFYKGVFFTSDKYSLDFPFQDDWSPHEEETATEDDFRQFLTAILALYGMQ